jgi:deoxyribodipyrimidine photo-lyase
MTAPVIYWMRRDLRLADNPALTAAVQTGVPVIPVFILDEATRTQGAAPLWRLGLGVAQMGQTLAAAGSRLILRAGPPLEVLQKLAEETGATAIHWNRLYDPVARERDTLVKDGLRQAGLEAHSHGGHLLFEPWTVETGQGGFYKVYTPFWNSVKDRDPGAPLPPPSAIPAPQVWPDTEALDDWHLGAAMGRGADVVARHVVVGEAAARDRLDTFINNRVGDYGTARDMLAQNGTSGLSENLTYGEIGPRSCWQAGSAARDAGHNDAEVFLKELVWREFAYHLVYHTPQITTENWRSEWDGFPWHGDSDLAQAWRRGRTGLRVVDAGLRQMYVTGTMHNRARMLVASYLTKHLMTDWRIGAAWFADCLIDWDPASNAMGWQWAAGSGPDASPYFRIFNPQTQAEKFDKDGRFVRAWVAEGVAQPPATALSYFDAIPKSWDMGPRDGYPADPVVGLSEGRTRALDEYKAFKDAD